VQIVSTRLKILNGKSVYTQHKQRTFRKNFKIQDQQDTGAWD
jgi:hypothetical protein